MTRLIKFLFFSTENKEAKYITEVSFNSSLGWKLNKPKFSHLEAPSAWLLSPGINTKIRQIIENR